MPTKRMTWEEICTKYPNQTILLSNIERTPDQSIISAIVEATGEQHSKTELNGMAMMSNGRYYCTGTTDELSYCGVAVSNA